MKGRGQDKAFLYEIVSNKRNGVDTDKMDYLMRDSKYCKSKDPVPSLDRIFLSARILNEKENHGRTLLAYKQKLYDDHTFHELFKDGITISRRGSSYQTFDTFLQARLSNHRQIYQHRDGCAVELMHGDALLMVQDSYTVTGSNDKEYKLHEAIHDMVAYCKVTDFVPQNILCGDQTLKLVRLEHGEKEHAKWLEARKLLERAKSGDYYACLGQVEPKPSEVRKICFSLFLSTSSNRHSKTNNVKRKSRNKFS